MTGFFITGTDTGVGKTRFTSLLASCLRGRGVAVRVCKPVATGAQWNEDGQLISDDTRQLGLAAGDLDFDSLTPYRFETPANPSLAARLAGSAYTINDLVVAVRRREQEGAVTLIEGVGGIMCPLTEKETIADLASSLGYPLLVVARRSLGTLNHLFLTLEAAQSHGLEVAGVIMSETEPPVDLASRHNPTEFSIRSRAPLLAVLPYEPDPALGQGKRIVDAIDWPGLPSRGPGLGLLPRPKTPVVSFAQIQLP